MTRVQRIDFATRIDLEPGATVSPGHAPAVDTPEGYLLVDALIARDGLLVYSDGETQWQEYRPRAELERAATSWATTPITDDHPQRMVDASTWAQVARGVHVDVPRVEGPYEQGGPSYLRAKLLVTDAALVRKIKDGQRELSIGFTSEVVPAVNGAAPDGTRCDAVQTSLLGNHTASVPKGRAGPTVRVLMDGHEVPMSKPPLKIKPPARTDEVGAPATMQEVIGPDGQSASVPTWVAAILEQWMSQQAASAAAPADGKPGAEQRPAPPPLAPSPVLTPPAIPAAPAAPMAAIPPAPPVAPAIPPAPVQRTADEPAPPAAAKDPDDEEEKDPMKDSAKALAPIRRKLDRLAALDGVAADVLDSDDSEAIARAFVALRMPSAKAIADAATGEALRALVEAAATTPRLVPSDNPWERSRPITDAADDRAAEIEFLKSQGYSA